MTQIRQRTPSQRVRLNSCRITLGVIVGLLAATVVLTLRQGGSPTDENDMLLELVAGALGYGAMGYLITTRAIGNRIGPLMLGLGVVGAMQGLLGALDSRATPVESTARTGDWVYGLASACQVLFVGGVVVLLYLAPTGRPLSARWKWLMWLTMASVGASALGALLFRAQLEAGLEPVGIGAVFQGAFGAVGAAFPLGLLGALVSLALRWYRAHGLERQQVSWVALGGLAGPLLVVTTLLLPEEVNRLINGVDEVLHGSVVWALAGLALPAGIAVAVLRHRLYDIDKLVSRTTSYALVSGVVIAVYVSIVAASTSLFQLPNQISVAVATLAAAAAFRPVLNRTRAFVDRRFDRSHYDAEKTVQAFAQRLRDEVDPDVVSTDLLAVLDRTVQPSVAGLWVREG